MADLYAAMLRYPSQSGKKNMIGFLFWWAFISEGSWIQILGVVRGFLHLLNILTKFLFIV